MDKLTTTNRIGYVQGEAETLISQAIDKNVPVETMEKLLAMRRELKAEHAREEFVKSMAKFQNECPVIEKKESAGGGSGFSYKYAPLDQIVGQVKGLLAKNGFSYTFDTKKENGALITYCHVKHKEGHQETSQFEIAIDTGARMNVSQKDGAASSYGKRYAFCNAFGILTGDEDTDARPTASEVSKVAIKAPTNAPVIALMSVKQENYINGLLKQKGKTKLSLEETCEKLFKKPFEKLTWDEASTVIDRLNKLPNVLAIPEKDKESFDPNESMEVDPDEAEKGIEAMKEQKP